ncbi:MAG TPA: alpha-amylase family glycosyl hydrolase [Catalimonadaceae bacterium]|nr:alpha-amylase family glycosyl hydrolase [Catalimonadaceae bacterium]
MLFSTFRLWITGLFFIFVSPIFGQNVSVTLQVNMNGLTIPPTGVHVAGSFQSEAGLGSDWNPATALMTDPNSDGIYTIQVSIPAGTYAYKFINGNDWSATENAPAECTEGNTFNRVLTVGNSALVLQPVRFNQCPPAMVLSVDMNGWPVSPQGVHVMGNFQEAAGLGNNWDPTTIPMVDNNNDGFYEARIEVPEGDYHYLFVNGTSSLGNEVVPATCSVSDGTGITKRSVLINSGGDTKIWNCYNNCGTCVAQDTASGYAGPWNDDVFYEIFVRSFYDSDNNGIGDFKGITQKLDYLNDGNPNTTTDLGIKGIWLMPMMKSPSYHGYDITDYYATEPDYGTMADFQELLDSCHKRGIRVILDLVINHTSSEHPWFIQSAANINGFRDWFVWKDTNPGYTGPWGQQVWHVRNGKYYYGVFYSGMPDLNFNHPPVRQEILNISNFWLNKGVDGFRLDAIQYLVEDGQTMASAPGTFSFLTEFNQSYKATNPDAFTVGEVWNPTSVVLPYVQPQKLDACFEFDLAGRIISGVQNGNPQDIADHLSLIKSSYPGQKYGTFLTNHDIDRVYTVLNENQAQMKQAASIYLTIPGVPFIYYGEEIGLTGSGADENKRRPMHWTGAVKAGFTTGNPWIATGSNYSTNNVATMSASSSSILSHYKNLIRLRNENSALRRGVYKQLNHFNTSLLAYARVHGQSAILVIHNLSGQPRALDMSLESTTLLPGAYYVTDVLTQTSLGTIVIDANGGFQNWSASSNLIPARTSWVVSVTVENPVSVKSMEQGLQSVSIYPNPATEQVYVQGFGNMEELDVQITDGQGKILWQGHPDSGQGISIRELPSGLYFMRIKKGTEFRVEKLVVSDE